MRTARDGAEALAMGAGGGDIDLLLTDVVMPNLDGGALAGRLKAIHPRMRVLFMSGYPDNVLRPEGFNDRSVRFLQKPFGQGALPYPLLYVLGAMEKGETPVLFNDKAVGGSFTMTSLRAG